jgi:hypothetical protein
MTDEGHIITFKTFYDPVLAHIVRGRLEANDIPCFVSDENTLVANPFYNQAIGGIKLNIFERDLEKCLAILAEDTDLSDEI